MDAITPEVEPVDDHEDELEFSKQRQSSYPPMVAQRLQFQVTKVVNYEIHKRRLEPLLGLKSALLVFFPRLMKTKLLTLSNPQGWQPPPEWDSYPSSSSYLNMAGHANGRPTPYVHIPHGSHSSPVSPLQRPVRTRNTPFSRKWPFQIKEA